MTSLTYAPWPFRSFAARSLEENERWWTTCYLQGEASRILAGWPHWRIIAGLPGSGKSTALAEVERREAARSLIVHYSVERWPGGRLVFSEDANHLAQMMACAAITIRDYLSNHPQQITHSHPPNTLSCAGCSISLSIVGPLAGGSMVCRPI